jgi:hypothetical protein
MKRPAIVVSGIFVSGAQCLMGTYWAFSKANIDTMDIGEARNFGHEWSKIWRT